MITASTKKKISASTRLFELDEFTNRTDVMLSAVHMFYRNSLRRTLRSLLKIETKTSGYCWKLESIRLAANSTSKLVLSSGYSKLK